MSEEKKMVTIRAAGQTREFAKGTSCREIAEAFQELYPNRILLARRNGKYLMELWKKVNEDCELEFLTMKDKAKFPVFCPVTRFFSVERSEITGRCPFVCIEGTKPL